MTENSRTAGGMYRAQFVYDDFLDGDFVDTCSVLKCFYLSATGPYSLEHFHARAREARFDVEELNSSNNVLLT
jgi:hypothetical protein